MTDQQNSEWCIVAHGRFLVLANDYVVARFPTKEAADAAIEHYRDTAPLFTSYSIEQRARG